MFVGNYRRFIGIIFLHSAGNHVIDKAKTALLRRWKTILERPWAVETFTSF